MFLASQIIITITMIRKLVTTSHKTSKCLSIWTGREHFLKPNPTLQLHRHTASPLQHFSTLVGFNPIFSSHEILLKKLEKALEHNQVSEAWEVFTDFRNLHGFPSTPLITKLITQLTYSYDPHWRRKGYRLLLLIYRENPTLLHYDYLGRMAISFARAQMPVNASTVLRIMLQFHKYPPMDTWRTAFLHMSKTEIGTYLASDLLVEICGCFMRHVEDHGDKNVKHLKLLKPDTIIVNLVLDACVRFRSTLRGNQIIELMASMGVVADAATIVLIAQIHEINGQRDELKKFKDIIDRVPSRLVRHYRQFYDSLLSLHFSFDEIDSAAELVLDMYKKHQGSFFCVGEISMSQKDSQKPLLLSVGSPNLKTALRLQIEPELLPMDFVPSVGCNQELVKFIDGRLVPSNKALAKLIHGYYRHGKIGELSKLLVNILKESDVPGGADLSSAVLGACIQICWLETAHDILDDMESAGSPMNFDAYMSLLRAYCKENMLKEAIVLIKQMKKRGWSWDFPNEHIISDCLSGKKTIPSFDTKFAMVVEKSGLAESLVREMKNGTPIPQLVYKLNSSIYYFCKGNMMEDALRTYQRMQEREIRPTVQSFAYLISGYSKLKMYREITILWGEIRRKMDGGDLTANRDLHEIVLLSFIRGGYFERVMEVLEYMQKMGMFMDKWNYKREFLKFHKHLYKSLKEEKAKTEAQRKRLEFVQAFRKRVGID